MSGPPEDRDRGRQARDIGVFTTIPMLFLAGPIAGWFLGHLAGQRWGHATAWETVGALAGLVAAVRQIQLLLRRHGGRS